MMDERATWLQAGPAVVCNGTETPLRTCGPLGLHLPALSVRVEADPVAAAPEGSPNAQAPAVLQDEVGEPGLLSEGDQHGHVARRVAGKRLRKGKPAPNPEAGYPRGGGEPRWSTLRYGFPPYMSYIGSGC